MGYTTTDKCYEDIDMVQTPARWDMAVWRGNSDAGKARRATSALFGHDGHDLP